MDYYTELKFKNDILSVAYILGYNGISSGSSCQGDCPRHGSTSGKCLSYGQGHKDGNVFTVMGVVT
ncbi:hypothetical protein KAJ27_23585 [bacterium]|nr:hypothetical protein [bacterium]